jgi:hypothetical protein
VTKAKQSKLATHNNAEDQWRRFKRAARDLGCKPDEKRFQNALRTVAKAKPSEKSETLRPKRRGGAE